MALNGRPQKKNRTSKQKKDNKELKSSTHNPLQQQNSTANTFSLHIHIMLTHYHII